MTSARLTRLERAAAGLRCRTCGQPLADRAAEPPATDPDPTERLGAADARELERLTRPAYRTCGCGRAWVDIARLTDDDKRAALVLLRRALGHSDVSAECSVLSTE